MKRKDIVGVSMFNLCKMTCHGGSENGSCACKRPSECELQGDPLFHGERSAAAARMEFLFPPASALDSPTQVRMRRIFMEMLLGPG